MEKSEDQTDEDETEWESSFADPVPFEASGAAAGSWKSNQENSLFQPCVTNPLFFFSFLFVSVGNSYLSQFQVKTSVKHQL